MPTFEHIVRRSKSPESASLLLLLAWIAASDGHIDKKEWQALERVARSGGVSRDLSAIAQVASTASIDDLDTASRVLRGVGNEVAGLMLQLAIGMALEDGRLTTTEGHIIRFIADLLGRTPQDLDSLFREMTGAAFPQPFDLSDPAWWRRRQSERTDNHTRTPPNSNTQNVDLARLRDLATLGLDESATPNDIRAAYRRMARVHHPDKFSQLGPEAVQAAEEAFLRIQSAYDKLLAS